MADINIDDHKLIYHPKRVSEWLEKGDCFPVYMEIGPTNRCNHRCIFCCYDFFVNTNHRDIDTEVMLRTLKEIADKGTKSIMFAGDGEPLLHKDIGLFTKKAKEFGLDVSMTTNGVLLTKDKIDQCLPNLSWIRFSIDSGSAENHSQIHRTNEADFEKLMNNIKAAVEFKKENNLNVTIGAQFLLIPQNVNEAVKLAARLKEIGADNLQIKPYSQNPNSINKFAINYEEYAHLEPELEKFNSPDFKVYFRSRTMKRIEEGNVYPKCFGLSYFALIDAKGDVLPCSLFYGKPDFSYGNLYQNSFSEIWDGEKRKKVLELVNKDISKCRHGCRLDVVNRYLNRLKNPQPHDNFI